MRVKESDVWSYRISQISGPHTESAHMLNWVLVRQTMLDLTSVKNAYKFTERSC